MPLSADPLPRLPGHNSWCAPGFSSAFYGVDRRYQILRRDGLPTLYLTLTISGNGFFRDSSDHVQKLDPGDLTLLEAGAFQNYGTWPQDGFWRHHWVHFQPLPSLNKWIHSYPDSGVKGLKILRLGNSKGVEEISSLLSSLHPKKEKNFVIADPLGEALALNTLEKALLLALRQSFKKPLNVHPAVAMALEWLQTDGARSSDLSILEGIVGISLSRLRHLFQQQTGQSLNAAKNRFRLEEAKRLLSDPQMSVGTTADSMKFSNQFSFSKWFLRQAGQRPNQYRKSVIHYADKGARRP